MNTDPLAGLVEQLREEAELFRRRGLEREADLEESIAQEIEAAVREWRHEELTVAEASKESGYSERHLRELLSDEGPIPNAGEDGSPRIRRADLPAKPGGGSPTLDMADGDATIAERALARRQQS